MATAETVSLAFRGRRSAGYYLLIAHHSGKARDVSGRVAADAAPVGQSSIDGRANQQWSLQPAGDGYYPLLTARHSGKALDVSGVSTDEWCGGHPVAAERRHRTSSGCCAGVASTPRRRPRPTRPLPRAGDVGPDAGARRSRAERRLCRSFLDEQFEAPASSYPTLPLYPTTRDTARARTARTCQRDNYTMYPLQNRFFTNALYGEDQLRQRVAFALHQIIVVSGVDITQPSWMAPYLQTLDRNAFGNLPPAALRHHAQPGDGQLPGYQQQHADAARTRTTRASCCSCSRSARSAEPRRHAAARRERPADPDLHAGRRSTTSRACSPAGGSRAAPATGVPNYLDPMVANEAQHDIGAKTLLNGVPLPAGQSTRAKDLNDAIDNIFNHPERRPVHREAADSASGHQQPESRLRRARRRGVQRRLCGARGDLQAVVRAILLDPEARGDVKTDPDYGRLGIRRSSSPTCSARSARAPPTARRRATGI